jgi:aryl-alcohol dehydrogenase-like predicted oxidoreductase
MQYTTLGKSNLEVSKIGFGCMSLKDDKNENSYLLNKAIEHGINYFDTADLYENGANEIKIGTLLKPHRQQVILATKVGNQVRADGSGWDWNPSKAHILAAVEKSLQRLQTDYIDLFQLHGGTIEDPIDETIEAFEILRSQGKIRHYGISSIRPNVIKEYIKRSAIVSVMMQYSLLDRRPEEECLAMLKAANIGVVARGGLAQGLLVDKAAKPYLDWTEAQVKQLTQAISETRSDGMSNTQIAIRFVLSNEAVSSAVIGIRTADQLERILAAADCKDLTAKEMTLFNRISPPKLYTDHR